MLGFEDRRAWVAVLLGGFVATAEGCAADRPLGDAQGSESESEGETGTDGTNDPGVEGASLPGPGSTVTNEATTTPLATETTVGSDSSDGTGPSPDPTDPDPTDPSPFVIAIDETFDDWDGSRWHMLSRGDDVYADNGTVALVDGHEAFTVHANAGDNDGYGFAIELFLELDQFTDMTDEDFHLTFDVYVPSETAVHAPAVAFAFYESSAFTPIYSAWHEVPAEQWVTISANIDSGDIEYSGFNDNPDDWYFDVIAIELIVSGESAVPGTALLFYLDNVLATNAPE